MKLFRQIALIIFLTLGIYSAIVYTACTKDACKTVNCINGGTCNGGTCTCDTGGGIGGTNCQIIYRNLYQGNYMGNAVVTYTNVDSAYMDSGFVNHTDDSNTLQFQLGPDSAYAEMQLVWNDKNTQMLSTPIKLVNNTSTGSTFLVPATSGGPGGGYVLTGNGSVSATSASLNLTAVPVDSAKPTIFYTLSNCPRVQ